MGNQVVEEKKALVRTFLYGPPKTKKTWWAYTAAEAGYNLLVLDGEKSYDIIRNISPEAQKRIRIIDAVGVLEKTIFSTLIGKLLQGKSLTWCDTDKRISATKVPGKAYFDLNLKLLTPNDVFIIDSWTAYASSIMTSIMEEKGVDITDVEKGQMRDYYNYAGNYSTWTSSQLMALNCNMLVIGHADVYDKIKKGTENSKNPEIEFSRIQPVSTSKPNAMKLAGNFTDMLRFYMIGNQFKIDSNASSTADGGSRVIPPGIYKWEDMPFKKVAELASIAPPTGSLDMPACVYTACYEGPQQIESNVIDATKGIKPTNIPLVANLQQAKVSPFAGLGKKQS